MIPEEDRGPAWLQDYGFTDFSQIEADVNAMEQYAKQLSADVTDNYVPHRDEVVDGMMTELPSPYPEFAELTSFLIIHNQAQNVSVQNVYKYAKGTTNFATAAHQVSKDYKGSDAFAHARVSDVDKAFDQVGIPAQQTGVPAQQTGTTGQQDGTPAQPDGRV